MGLELPRLSRDPVSLEAIRAYFAAHKVELSVEGSESIVDAPPVYLGKTS